MIWRAIYFNTNPDGVISKRQDVTDIINNFKIEKTVGNELFLKSGDVTLELLKPLPKPIGFLPDEYIAIYLAGTTQPFDIYHLPDNESFSEVDQKRDRYSIRLNSIQKKFYDDLKDVIVEHSLGANQWGADSENAAVHVEKVGVTNANDVPVFADDRWCFSLGDLVINMAGKTETKGYRIDQVTFPGPLMMNNDLPVIYRGLGFSTTTSTKQDAVDLTFKDHKVTWMDLFKLISFAFNAFIEIKPKIVQVSGADVVAIEVNIVPKINVTAASPKTVKWLERKLTKFKFRLDGVKLSSTYLDSVTNEPSFSYEQGDTDGDKVFSRDIEIADPDLTISDDFANILYWSVGLFDSGISKYKILGVLGVGDSMNPYFSSGLVEPFYNNMVSAGDGYTGEIFYAGEDLLDAISVDCKVIQLSKFKINRRKKVTIEGIQIA